MFITKHNLPVSVSDDLTEVINVCSSFPAAAKRMTCGRTKCTQLIQNVIGETICEETIKKLKEQKFSIIIDEATDRGTVKNLAVVARLLHKT